MASDSFLYPSVGSYGTTQRIDRPGSPGSPGSKDGPVKGEFDKTFEDALKTPAVGPQGTTPLGKGGPDLDKIREPLKFSAHATQRLNERKIQLDGATLGRVNDALDKAAAKGVEDTLVLTPDAALIVSVKNRTVITAMDRGSLNGNVFTNIDGAVIV